MTQQSRATGIGQMLQEFQTQPGVGVLGLARAEPRTVLLSEGRASGLPLYEAEEVPHVASSGCILPGI